MTIKICEVWEGPFKINGIFEKHLRKCNRKAKYYSPENNTFYCEIHLKKALKFYVNPIDIETNKEIDRHILYKFGKIEFVRKVII